SSDLAGNVPGSRTLAGLWCLLQKARPRTGIQSLLTPGLEIAPHLLSIAQLSPVETSSEMPCHRDDRAVVHWAALGLPLWQAAIENGDFLMAEDAKAPPDSRGGKEAAAVIDDDPVAIAQPEAAHLAGENLRGREHVGQGAVRILDLVDVEEDGSRNMLGLIFGPRVPFFVWQVIGRI